MSEAIFFGEAEVMGLRAAATVLAAASAFGAFLAFRPMLARLVPREEDRCAAALAELFLFDVNPRHLTWGMCVASVVMGVVLAALALHAGAGGLGAALAFAVGGVLGFWVPRLILFIMQRRRRDRLSEQLVDGLVTLANGMRAGLNLVQSMRLICENAPPPISQEFSLMIREFEHGSSVDEVLRRAAARIKLHHYQLLFAAMETARARGGNLPETLDRLGEALREIMRLEEKVKSLTAQNRMSARMMGAMPLVVAGIYWLIEPTWVQILVNDQWGLLLLVIAGIFWVGGFLWIRKIVTFEI